MNSKPTALRVIQGNPGRRPIPQGEPQPVGALEKPAKIRGRASQIWDQHAAIATWLTSADSTKLHVFCELYAEFERSPRKMVAARIAQLRAAGSELGLDPSSRARLGKVPDGKPKDPTDRFFKD